MNPTIEGIRRRLQRKTTAMESPKIMTILFRRYTPCCFSSNYGIPAVINASN
jgi:hypothetical protein